MNINGPPPRGVPDRPHTSNGRRPGPPPDSPGRGRGPYPGPAMRSASAGRPAPTRPYDRSYTDANGPPPMPMAPINRSATAPLEIAGPMHGEPAGDSHDTDDLLDSYYGSAPDDPDMPNFDAMPDAKSGPVDESLPGLEGPRPAPKTPTESKPPGGQYAAFTPHSAGSHSAPVSPDTNPPNQFANAGFQFDLPNEPHTMSPGDDRSGYSYNSPPEAYGESVPGYPFPHRQDSHNNTMPGYSAAGGGPPRPYRMNQPAMANEMEAVDPQQNPDALPHHPVPFRPGHDGGKPAPVRQYAGAPNGPTSPTSTSASPQQDMGPFAKPVTRQELEELQLAVKKKSSNQATHLLLAQKLVEAATVLVDEAHLDAKGKTKAREKYVMDAYKIVKKLVSSGYGDAQFYLADCYGQGQLGLEVDNKEAYNLYHSAAKSGHAQAAYRVAVCCEIGHEEGGGTKRDPFKAVQWYKRAASLGDPPAMYKMGMIMLKGLLGQTKNPREGVTWLKRAAEKADVENPHALHELALMYANASPNDIVVRDEEYAKQLFCQAGELGYKFSQFRLAAAYEYGLMGCPVDPRQSIIWYTHAAAQGEHQSELALSGWYLTGSEGILQQSDTEAYLWARKAATAGLAKAEYAMGYFTEVGIGVTANLDDAKRWYWRAAGEFPFTIPYGSSCTVMLTTYSPRIPESPRTPRRTQEGRQSDAEDASFSVRCQSTKSKRRGLCCNVIMFCDGHGLHWHIPFSSLLFFSLFFLFVLGVSLFGIAYWLSWLPWIRL